MMAIKQLAIEIGLAFELCFVVCAPSSICNMICNAQKGDHVM